MTEQPNDVVWRVYCTVFGRRCRFRGYRWLPVNARDVFYSDDPVPQPPCPRCGARVRPEFRKGSRSLSQRYMRLQLFVRGFRAMYYACRVDYPCEGCEQPRWMAFRNALGWAWDQR